ncbi:MAG: (deoxy)nucleoside triphosphate pyrophosphohydrolase [Mycobacteriales bacterium]
MPIAHASVLVGAEVAVLAAAARDLADAPDVGLIPTESGIARGLVGAGDVLAFRGVPHPIRVVAADDSRLTLEGPRGLRYRETYASTGAGAYVTCELFWRVGRLTRRRALAALTLRCASLRAAVRRRRRLVVAAAVIRAGRVLAAQRGAGGLVGDRWELPGGKVEPGESPPTALRRECAEELGVDVEIGARIGVPMPLDYDGYWLEAFAATLPAGAEPVAREHRELRWIDAGSLDTIDWLPTDRALLPHVRAALRRAESSRTQAEPSAEQATGTGLKGKV